VPFANLDYILYIASMEKIPNLTYLWNEASFKLERGEINLYEMNDCWGALRLLEKHGLCKINNY